MKSRTIILSLLFVSCFNVSSQQLSQEDFLIDYGSFEIYVGQLIEDFSVFNDAHSIIEYESEFSSEFDSICYSFDSVDIYRRGSDGIITQIKIKDRSISTSRGIRIGDNEKEILKKYSEVNSTILYNKDEGTSNPAYVVTWDIVDKYGFSEESYELFFLVEDGAIIGIQFTESYMK
jgi:hypothetical protein